MTAAPKPEPVVVTITRTENAERGAVERYHRSWRYSYHLNSELAPYASIKVAEREARKRFGKDAKLVYAWKDGGA